MTLEEARLQQLFSEKTLIEARRALLEREATESVAGIVRATSVEAFDLQAIDGFRRYVTAQRIVIAAALVECDKKIAEQRLKLMEARRNFELLTRLKEKRFKVWNGEFAREIEAEASEAFLAKWNQRSG